MITTLVNEHQLKLSDIIKNNNIYVDKNIYDISVCIGTRGRQKYLTETVRRLKIAISKTNLKINLYVVEHDTDKQINIDCRHIFVQSNDTLTENMYSRALIADIGFLSGALNSKWYMYHDSDLLVTEDFFNKIEILIQSETKWIQPYSQKRVINLSVNATDKIFNGENLTLTSNEYRHELQNGSGAPGGSILVKKESYLEVGGFDYELFYGYAPEDSMFWVKLECLIKPINAITNCHQGGALYADDIDIYHLYHTNQISNNSKHHTMMERLKYFWSLDYESKKQYINIKKHKLLSQCEQL